MRTHRPRLSISGCKAALVAGLAILVLAPGSARAGKTIFELADPRGDDHGFGSLVYPLNPDYASGDLDLITFAARRGKQGTWFEATFARPIRVPDRRAIDAIGTSLDSVARNGFYTFNLDVYIDIDRAPDSGGIRTLPGRNVLVDASSAWERAIVLTPQPHAARGELKRILQRQLRRDADAGDVGEEQAAAMRIATPDEVDRSVFFPTLVRVNGQTVAFFVPDSFLGGPAEAAWGYTVAVTGASLVQSYDVQASLGLADPKAPSLMVLPIAEGRPRDRFGAPSVHALQAPLVDILTPPGVRQETVLRSYDRHQGLLAELLATVPADSDGSRGAAEARRR